MELINGPEDLKSIAISGTAEKRVYGFMISKDILTKILNIASDFKISPFNFLLAAYYVFLRKISHQSDFVIDSPISTRDNEDFAKIIGWLTGHLITRAKIDDEISFKELLINCKETIIKAMDHIYYNDITLGIKRIVNGVDEPITWEQSISSQFNLVYENANIEVEKFKSYHYVTQHAFSDINFDITAFKNGLIVNCYYKTSAIDPSKISEICENFVVILKRAINSPYIKLIDL